MPDTCAAASLGYILNILNILDGVVIDIEPCDQPRAHQVILSAHPGYVKSIGLRRTTQGR